MNLEPESAAHRIPILVAEDSDDNRLLLDLYCRKAPYDLTFAADGQQAVRAYQSAQFEIVIMDMQMPVMDGLEATRMIRDLERAGGRKRTPILALTANVALGETGATRQAGCDLYLAKPISKHVFLNALDQWRPNGWLVQAAHRTQIPPGSEAPALSYLQARQSDVPLSRNLVRRGAFDELLRMARYWVGTGGSHGFPDLAHLGASLELACVKRDLGDISRHTDTLAAYLDRVCHGLQMANNN